MIIATNDREFELDIDNNFDFTKGGPTLLLDGDPVAYSSASACDRKSQVISINGNELYRLEGGVTNLYRQLSVKNKQEFMELLRKNPSITHSVVTTTDDSDNMYHTIKAQINKIVKRTKAGSLKMYLTDGATNFRITENIDTIQKYKGSRSSTAKPQLLGKARDYMVSKLGAIMCVGHEADDELAFEHRIGWETALQEAQAHFIGEPEPTQAELDKVTLGLCTTVLGTIDKDIGMCAGKFINPDQDIGIEDITPFGRVRLEVKERSKKIRFNGYVGFMAQLLLGDTCDNIPTVQGCGDVRVYETLKDCKTKEEAFKAMYFEMHEGLLRKHVKSLKDTIGAKIKKSVELGLVKDNVSAIAKATRELKEKTMGMTAYTGLSYIHWENFKIAEDGVVTDELLQPIEDTEVRHISPREYLLEVGRLLYMLDTLPNEAGDHLWLPNEQWCLEVEREIAIRNMDRVETKWGLLP
tara:strand:+ start:281 stop:1684 length:1404 start_codon:yes stop_codon:yes gene_type:complete